MKPVRQITLFVLIGGIGFVVDASILTTLSVSLSVNIYISRLISFSSATLVTWLLNRTYTFKQQVAPNARKLDEYRRYIVIQIGGGLINLLVFSILILIRPDWSSIPILPLAIGAVFGLIFNFTGTRFWVYTPKKIN